MISEIAYTETLTFWSTLISAPLVYFGSWAVSGSIGKLAGEAGVEVVKAVAEKSILQGLVGTITSPIKEVFQEIIEDGFIEALAENLVGIAGGSDDLGFWVSSLSTSARETTGALGQLVLGGSMSAKNTVFAIQRLVSGDKMTDIRQQIALDAKQKQDAKQEKMDQMGFWNKMLRSNFLNGLFMTIPAVFFGTFSFVALSGLNKMTSSAIKLSPSAQAHFRSWQHNRRKDTIADALKEAVGTLEEYSPSNMFYDKIEKPSELDGVKTELDEVFEEQQEQKPFVPIHSEINSNPKTQSKNDLANTFNTIVFEGYFNEWSTSVYEDTRFKSIQELILRVKSNYRIIGHTQAQTQILDAMKAAIKDNVGELAPADQRFFDMWGTSYLDPHVILCGVPKSSVIRDLEIIDYVIEGTKTSKDAMLADLQEIYDVGVSLDMFVICGEMSAKIPDGTPDVDRWIINNGLNPTTTKIVIVPSILANPESDVLAGKGLFNEHNYQEGTPSPYWPFFDKFRNELRDILYDNGNGVIQRNLFADASKFISLSEDEKLLTQRLTQMKLGAKSFFKTSLNLLNTWYAEFEHNLNERLSNKEITDLQYETLESRVSSLFREQYFLYGHNKENSLYMPTRLAIYGAARALYEYSHHKYLEEYNIDDFMRTTSIRPHYDLFNKKSYIPMKDTLDINAKLESYLRLEKKTPEYEIQEILRLTKPFSDRLLYKIRIEQTSKDVFEGLPNTKRVELFKKIVDCPNVDVLKMIESMKDLSKILVNHPSYDQEGGKYYKYDGGYIRKICLASKAITSDSLTRIAFILIARSSQLKTSDFKAVGLEQEIDENQLALLKEHISRTVRQILEDINYINLKDGSRLFKNPSLNKLLYKAIEKIHAAVAVHEGDIFIPIEQAYRILDIPSYGAKLRLGQVYSQDSIFEIIQKINGFIYKALYSGKNIISLIQELPYYYDAINALDKLSHKIDLVENIYKRAAKINKIYGSPYSSLWYDPAYKAWNVLTQLQDLFGTDPLSFESLDDKIFDRSSGTGLFEPHHIDRNHKESLALYDQILTYNRYNPTYDTMSIAQQKILKEGVRKLIQMGIDGKGSAKGGYINADDIRKVFAGQTFDVKSRKTGKTEHNIPILSDKARWWQINKKKTGLWDYHFSDFSVKEKLSDLNKKIERFRNTFQQTSSQKEAYMSVLSFKYGTALTRFKNDASKFVNYMFTPSLLRISPLFPLNFGDRRHLTLTRILF